MTNIAYIKSAKNKSIAVWNLVKHYNGTKTKNMNSVLKNIDPHNKDKKSVLNTINNFL